MQYNPVHVIDVCDQQDEGGGDEGTLQDNSISGNLI